jgi:glycosyltransferase involved in cell wall biosynthesis
MRILYFAYVNLDRPNACQAHTLGLLRGFGENRCQVDAVVPRPLGPLPQIPSVRFHFLPSHNGSRRNYLTAIPLSLLTLFRLCQQHHFQALYARDMDVFVGPRWCSRHFNLPLYLEVDDAPVEGHYPPLLHELVTANVKADYRQATGLIVPSVPRCQQVIQGFGVAPEKVHPVLNGADLLAGRPLTKPQARKHLGLPAKSFCLGYVGSVNERYDFETMLQALRLCQSELAQSYLVIVGDGSHLNMVKTRAQNLGLADRVLFTGFLQPEALVEVVPAMDVGLMNLTAEEVRRHGPIHTKLATYGLFGLPVITAGDSLAGYPVGLHDTMWLVPPEDPRSLAAACLHLSRHPEERQKLVKALKRYVRKHLTWRSVAQEIVKIMSVPEMNLA